MRKELTWLSYALLSSVLIVFIIFGNSKLDIRFHDRTIVLPSWAWFVPVFLLLCFVILFFRILREKLVSFNRNIVFLGLGISMIIVLEFLKSYFQLLRTYLEKGQLQAVPIGGKTIWYSGHTIPFIVAFQIFIAITMVLVVYFWIRRNKLKRNGISL